MPSSTNVTNLKINKLTEAQFDTAVQQGVIGENEISIITDAEAGQVIQYDTIPTASQEYVGTIVQYTGATDANYTNGYFYKCSGAPRSATIRQTTGTSLSDLAVDIDTFETQITTSGSYAFQYDDFESSWTFRGNNVNLADYGITYNGTAQDWDIITVVYSAGGYAWSRVDVQPAPVVPDPLPSQTGNAGKFLTTDGTDASWSDKPIINRSSGSSQIYISDSDPLGPALNMGTYAIGIGCGNVRINGSRGVAIGYASFASAEDSIGISGRATAAHAIQIGKPNGYDHYTNSDANTFKVGNANGNFEIMSADGTIPADRLTHAINKYSTMPTAASTNEGWIVQFTGTTDSTYTHGYFYECVTDDNTTWYWKQLDVQPSSGGGLPDQTGQGGKFLTTDGTDTSWSDTIDTSAIGNLKILTNSTTNGIFIRDKNSSLGTFIYSIQNGLYVSAAGNLTFTNSLIPSMSGWVSLGSSSRKWVTAYLTKLNNGADITVPTTGGTMAVIGVNTTATLAAADWSSNTQTVTVTGMTATGIVFVSPDPSDQTDYTSAGILCTAQAAGTLTFTCNTTPSNDIDVVVVMM